MNPIVKIISNIIIKINYLIENIDRRTADTIKQVLIFFVVTSVVLSIIFGYMMGKKSAKRHGKQIIGSTNTAFETEIKRSRDEGKFRSMLESDLIKEMDTADKNKLQFPSRDKLEPETKDEIIEPEDAKKRAARYSEFSDRDKIAEIDRDEKKPADAVVKELERKRKISNKRIPEIIKDDDKTRKNDSEADIRDMKKNDGPQTLRTKRIYKKNQKSKDSLQPIDNRKGLIKK